MPDEENTPPMPSTRRRILLGAASTVALAGCNEETTSGSYETVTPVSVPRSDEEILETAADIERPEIPSAVITPEARLDAAIEHVEELLEELNAIDGEVHEEYRPRPDAARENARDAIREARQADDRKDALATLRRTVREVSRLAGFANAQFGKTDPEDLKSAIDAEREARERLSTSWSYCVTNPVVEHLPTLYAAESDLDDLPSFEEAESRLDRLEDQFEDARQVDDIATFDRMGRTRRTIELHRWDRESTTFRYAAATDDERPSIREELVEALDGIRPAVEAIAEEYGIDSDPPEGGPLVSELRNTRQVIGRRAERHLTDIEAREKGLLVLVVEVGRWLTEFNAVDEGITRTVDRLDGGELPAESIVEEKRRAVESVADAAEGSAIQRAFAERAPAVLTTGDRNPRRGAGDEKALARTHFLYAAAAEWADDAMERGAELTTTLQAQQS